MTLTLAAIAHVLANAAYEAEGDPRRTMTVNAIRDGLAEAFRTHPSFNRATFRTACQAVNADFLADGPGSAVRRRRSA